MNKYRLIGLLLLALCICGCSNEAERGKIPELHLTLKEGEFELMASVYTNQFPDFTRTYKYQLTEIGLKDVISQVENTALFNYQNANNNTPVSDLKTNKTTGYWIKTLDEKYTFHEPDLNLGYPNSSLFSTKRYSIQGEIDLKDRVLLFVYTDF